ncbi:MAG: type III-A CRISPR-associated protein Csm2 [Desulfobacteraceae bacterium IS3]|nr:MAG: type III-A CRISPR-associated protein Csm2 [Desulfobacteraceae bacterium IS3]
MSNPEKRYEQKPKEEDPITKFLKEMPKNNFSQVKVEDFAPDGKWACQIAEYLVKGKKTKINQLRKIFTELKKIQLSVKRKQTFSDDDKSKLYLLMPLLAFANARELIDNNFYKLMKVIIGDANSTKIRTKEDYERFVQFMTAIVAYHKKAE